KGEELLYVAVGATPASLAPVHIWTNMAKTIAMIAAPTQSTLVALCSPSSAVPSPSFFTNTRKSWSPQQETAQPTSSLTAAIIFTIDTRARLSRSSISGWRASTDSLLSVLCSGFSLRLTEESVPMNVYRRNFVQFRLFVLIAVALELLWQPSVAAGASPSKLVIGYASTTPRLMPLWVVRDQGFFA